MMKPVIHETLHASRGDDIALCGADGGRLTRPKETVNCPGCRVAINHVRDRYPHHSEYTDWRLTPEQERRATQRLLADMYGGADDD